MLANKEIQLEDIVFQVEGNIVSVMGKEKVMLNVEKGKYFNLGEIGGEIWDLIEEHNNVYDITQSLMEKYEVSREECVNHVLFYLNQLSSEGLIKTIKESR